MVDIASTPSASPLETRPPYRRYTLREALEAILQNGGERSLDLSRGDDHCTLTIHAPATQTFLAIDRFTHAQRRRLCTALEAELPGADVVDEDRLRQVAMMLVQRANEHPIGRIPDRLQRILDVPADANSHDVFCALSNSLDPKKRAMRFIAVQEAIAQMRPPVFSDWRDNGEK